MSSKQPEVLPSDFNALERTQAVQLLDWAIRCTSAYDGPWEAAWMDTPFTAHAWKIREARTQYDLDADARFINFSWQRHLGDGSLLTSPKNENLCLMLKKMCFLVRELPVFGVTMPVAHIAWMNHIVTIAQWLSFKHRHALHSGQPFHLIDQKSVHDFFKSIIPHGKGFALGNIHSCATYFYQEAIPSGHITSQTDLFKLPEDDVRIIQQWLLENDFYSATGRMLGRYVNRQKLSTHLHFDYASTSNRAFSAFLRQFEPELLAVSPTLLVPASRLDTEYLTHRTPTLHDARTDRMSRASCMHLLDVFKSLCKLDSVLPGCAPYSNQINWKKVESLIDRHAGPDELTPWIPIETSLIYLNESIRWIVVYGKELLDFYVQAAQYFIKHRLFFEEGDTASISEKKRFDRDAWVTRSVPKQLQQLHISSWTTCFTNKASNPFEMLRIRPSLNDALQIYFGAVAILIGTLKPIRVGELTSLKRRCVSSTPNGTWMTHANEKHGTEGLLPESSRPVPQIVGRAIEQLSTFGETLFSLYSDIVAKPYVGGYLFVAPNFGQNATPSIRRLDRRELSTAMARLCDYVNLPPDKHGRRWYVQIQELRKSYLLNFFWNFRFSALDTAGWMANHRDSEQIYSYIRANFDGDEISGLEAQYAAEQLWSFDQIESESATNVSSLYHAVCRHFHVRDVSKIAEQELLNWLTQAFQSGLYKIRVYRLTGENFAPATIAFEICRRAS